MGIPDETLPIMIGARFEFTLRRGASHQLFENVAAAPEVLTWLPERDRLYVVDAALRQITEFGGLDPYREEMSVIQIFQ